MAFLLSSSRSSPITAEDGSMGKLRTAFAPGLHSAILATKRAVTPRQRKPGVEPQPLQLRQAFVTLPTRPVLRTCLLPRVLLQASSGISAPPRKHVLEGEAKWRVATFRVCVASSITLLEVFDLLLRLVLSGFNAICAILRALGLGAVMTGLRTALAQGRAAAVWGPMPGPKQRVAIIGASFGGLACARMLRRDFDVTVIDQHDYFEYTPGILRLFIQPEHFRGLSASLRRVAGIKFVHGRVDRVGQKSVRVRPAKGSSVSDAERLFGTKVAFDYGIIACGSAYSAGIKAGPSSALLQERAAFWKLQARRVADARTVVVVGGGPVGVELAAEIAFKHPGARIVLVHSASRLLNDFTEGIAAHSERWLRQRNVEVLLGHRCYEVSSDDADGVSAQAREQAAGESGARGSVVIIRGETNPEGLKVEADLVFWCRGFEPSAASILDDDIKRAPAPRTEEAVGAISLAPDGTISVDSHLQVLGRERIFAVGDVMSVRDARDERLGHTAEVQARIATHNLRCRVLRSQGSPKGYLRKYHPSDESLMYCVSLGPFNGSARVGPLEVHGVIAALLKWSIEWVKVAQAQERPVGKLIWSLVDIVTACTVDVCRAPPHAEEGR